jgi:hypothetical protein
MIKFIHQTTAIYLSLIILLRMLAMPITLLNYSFNKNRIADNFCENRLRPDLHCAGKCYLTKQLAKSGANTEAPDQKGNTKISLVDYFEKPEKFSFALHQDIYIQHALRISVPLNSGFTGNLLRPPIS